MNQSFMSITAHSGPIFRRGTFREKDVLISESLEYVPFIRIVMIIICLLIGIGTFVNLIMNYMKYRLIFKPTRFHRIIVPIILLLNILFHVAHYAHNIYDPAAYFEPKKLYSKLIMTEMEQTFFFNFPLSIVFVIATRKLLTSCTIGQLKSIHMPILVTIYGLMSMVSVGHYTYEPPWKFSFLCNLTITGETIFAFLLIVVAWFIHRSNLNESLAHRYSRLATNEKSNPNIQQQQQFKDKISDYSTADDEAS